MRAVGCLGASFVWVGTGEPLMLAYMHQTTWVGKVQVAVASNTPGLLTYLIAAIFVPPIVVPSFLACVIVMLMAISAATCALDADF